MSNPHNAADTASGHDDHGHGHGHDEPSFETIPENSSVDGFLNFAAWFGFVALLTFSFIMVTTQSHEAAAAGSQAPASQTQEAPPAR
jgi:hypothetical protein